MASDRPVKIAVVGDVHDQWEPEDGLALKHLNVDLALFVGDFGNESVEIVRAIAALDLPKAVILGNHDAWYTATHWGRKKCPYNRRQEDWVQQQLDLLGTTHVGYSKLDMAEFSLSIVGGRPFSWGGSEWRQGRFYQERYRIANLEESAARIMQAVQAAAYDTVIFLGHSGPKGLGERPEDPCGRDWKPLGGDHGDPDLAAAIAHAKQVGKTVPLVAFGHMHHRLRHTQTRLRKQIDISPTGTVYLNAASVPRIIKTETTCLRNFSLVSLQNGRVQDVSLVWVNSQHQIASEESLYRQVNPVWSVECGV
ncbi:MAG: TIGR04168 family protein [Pseudanabaenales cyanobacterium]|nr:TIGR04168 family protein [Pseudanabaenales cyanobacterium]